MTETYCGAIAGALDQWGDRIAFEQPHGRCYSYRQTATLIEGMSHVLQARGSSQGRGVGILSRNFAEAWMASQAVQYGRGYYVSLPWRSSLEDLVYIAQDAEIEILICHPDFAQVALAISAQCPRIAHVYTLGDAAECTDLLAKVGKLAAVPRRGPDPATMPDDICVLWYTGGTTGRPKGAIHTQATVLAAIKRSEASFELPDTLRYLAAAPLSHGGWTFLPPTLLRGGTIVVMENFDAGRFIELVNEYDITLAVGVPTMLYAVLDALEERRASVPSLQRFVYGGSPISEAQIARARSRMGNIFTQFYGQSEILGAACVLRAGDHDAAVADRLASCGQAVDGVDVALFDDSGNTVSDRETGELCFRTGSAMLGYWKKPELTAETLQAGWVHSGDLARRDAQGFYMLVDRKKDMIVSGGYNVYPAEVEAVLCEHPGVATAAVIGVPDAKWGEAVKAFVVLRPGFAPEAENLRDYVRDRKGGVNAPKTIDFVLALPLTAAGKPDKKVLRAQFWSDAVRQIG